MFIDNKIQFRGVSMRTIKQVSDLTGISVRALHYYDQIGLLKPSNITEAGYRLYDDEALKTLQQVLFFKELDIPLKEVKEIMTSPYFDKMKALEEQKKLLLLKRKRLNGLIDLINKTLKGEGNMNFEEFDMSEYYKVLEEYKLEHEDKIIKAYGSIEKYNESIEKIKSKEVEIAKSAIRQYGSIERYAKAIKNNLNSEKLENLSEKIDKFKKDLLEGKHPRLKELYRKLIEDTSKDPTSKEIQEVAEEISATAKKDYDVFQVEDIGEEFWYSHVQMYLVFRDWIKAFDDKYGEGTCKFVGEALKKNLDNKKPRAVALYEELLTDLSKDPASEEIQQIVKEIEELHEKTNEIYNLDQGDNYMGYMAESYLSNDIRIKATDKKYGEGASKFIGEAFKFYSEKNKL